MAKKWIPFIMIICTLILPVSAFAHTHLESSSPSNKEIVTTEMKEITLKFGTSIGELSSFEVFNAENKKVEGLKVTVEKDSMIGTLDQALPNGDYTVKWSILGKDTHVMKDSLSFTVNALATDKKELISPPDASTQVDNGKALSTMDKGTMNAQPTPSDPSDQGTVDAPKDAAADTSTDTTPATKEVNSVVIYVVIIGGAILICAGLYFTRRVKK